MPLLWLSSLPKRTTATTRRRRHRAATVVIKSASPFRKSTTTPSTLSLSSSSLRFSLLRAEIGTTGSRSFSSSPDDPSLSSVLLSPNRNRFLNAARGYYLNEQQQQHGKYDNVDVFDGEQRLMKVFPLTHDNFPSLAQTNKSDRNAISTPSEFHELLCSKIRTAQHRIYLASLYVGPAAEQNDNINEEERRSVTYPKEHDLLMSLQDASLNRKNLDIRILLDHNRALRPVPITRKTDNHSTTPPTTATKDRNNNNTTTSTTSTTTTATTAPEMITSASACYRAIIQPGKQQSNSTNCVADGIRENEERQGNEQKMSGVYLFSVLPNYLQSILPNPYNEIAGVFHIKCYIVDNDMILSGANLSEEYFTDRTDRYLWITDNDNNREFSIDSGLVQCYADMIVALCQHSEKYTEEEDEKRHFENSNDGNGSINIKNRESQSSSSSSLSAATTTKKSKRYNYFSSKRKRRDLLNALTEILTLPRSSTFEEHAIQRMNADNQNNKMLDRNIVAYAIPTFQFPRGYFGRNLLRNNHNNKKKNRIPSDTDIICDLIQCLNNNNVVSTEASNYNDGEKTGAASAVRLATAYLNLTDQFQNVIKKISYETMKVHLLSAGRLSHGFRPNPNKRGNKGKDWIPSVFDALARNAVQNLQRDSNNNRMGMSSDNTTRLWYYQRENWTFHAKGLWLAQSEVNDGTNQNNKPDNVTPEQPAEDHNVLRIRDASALCAVTHGSGNYGCRSESLDMESNLILIFPDRCETAEQGQKIRKCQQYFQNEWNQMCQYAVCSEKEESLSLSRFLRILLPYVRPFF